MASKTMAERVAEARKALFDEGFLGKQFEEIECLQTPNEPSFVEGLFNMFLNEMGGFLSKLEKELGQAAPNCQVLDKILHQIKGCTSSVGANKLYLIGNEMRAYALKGEIQNCRDAFERLEIQFDLLGSRMGDYFELCREAERDAKANPSSSSAAKDGWKGKGLAK